MARVPTNNRTSVQQSAVFGGFSRQQATPDQFGAASGRALSNLGTQISQAEESVSRTIQRFQKRQDDSAFDTAKVKYDTATTSLLYGDGTPENPGYFTSEGENALDGGPLTMQRIDEIKLAAMEGQNPDVAARLEISLSTQGNRHLANIGRHQGQQRNIVDQKNSDAIKAAAIDDAARNFTSDEIILNSLIQVTEKVNQDHERNGTPEAALPVDVKLAQTQVLKEAVKAALSVGDTKRAKELLKEFKKQIEATEASRLNAMVLQSVDLAKVQEQSDRINALPDLTNAERLAKARQISDPEVRQGVVTDMKRRNLERSQALQVRIDSSVSAAMVDMTNRNIGRADWAARNPEKWALIKGDPKARKQLRAFDNAQAEGRTFAETSDGLTEAQIRDLPDVELANMPLEKLVLERPNLTNEEWDRVVKLRDIAKDRLNEKSENAVHYKNGDRVLSQFAPVIFGFGVRDASDAAKKKQRSARQQMALFISDTIKTTGSPPSIVQMQDEAQIIFRKGEVGDPVSQFFNIGATKFGTEVRQLSDAQKKEYTVDLSDVDDTVINRTIAKFNEFGIKATKEQVAQFLGAQAVGDGPRQQLLLGQGTISAPSVKPRSPADPLAIPRITAPQAPVAPTVDTAASGIRADELLAGKVDTKAFKDTTGVPTIGVGFNLNKPGAATRLKALGLDIAKVKAGTETISKAQAEQLFTEDVATARSDAKKAVSSFDSLSPARQDVLVNMSFNLGLTSLRGFKGTIKAINEGNFGIAAQRMLKTKWAKQVGQRAKDLAKIMKDG